ncbi:MAG: TlpA disulfide reductase family protein [Actinomycetia bacterium]|nr:TlpA disulfide reductase family protein [Actinomycetes bacterium]
MTEQRSRTSPALVVGVVVTLVVVLTAAWWLVRDTSPATVPSAAPVARAGQPAPSFEASSVDGTVVSLAALRGKPVWLTFGATWCAECRSEAADLEQAASAARDQGVVTVMVFAGDDPATVRDYASRLGLTMTQVPDPQRRVAARYQVSGVPTHYFIGADQTIQTVRVGLLSRSQMDAALADLTR